MGKGVVDLTVLDLFSAAAGGWSLGAHRAGFRTIAAAEKVVWRRDMYARNNPEVILYEDVRDVTAERLYADLGTLPWGVLGSPPCTDISSANTKGQGVDGSESGLYFEAIRIVAEIRDLAKRLGISGARWFALENSDRVRTRGFDRLAAALEAHGHSGTPFVVGTGNAGATHQRKRAWWIGLDPAAAREQRGAPRFPWLDADANGADGQISRPDWWRWLGGEEAGRGFGHPLGANADADELRVERGAGSGREEVGQEAVIAGLARVFRGPVGSADLSSHIRAYAGLPSGLADSKPSRRHAPSSTCSPPSKRPKRTFSRSLMKSARATTPARPGRRFTRSSRRTRLSAPPLKKQRGGRSPARTEFPGFDDRTATKTLRPSPPAPRRPNSRRHPCAAFFTRPRGTATSTTAGGSSVRTRPIATSWMLSTPPYPPLRARSTMSSADMFIWCWVVTCVCGGIALLCVTRGWRREAGPNVLVALTHFALLWLTVAQP